MNKGRLESFSDGVVSVSLTLMLYKIQLPAEFTWNGLWKEAHNFFGYVFSFIYVGTQALGRARGDCAQASASSGRASLPFSLEWHCLRSSC